MKRKVFCCGESYPKRLTADNSFSKSVIVNKKLFLALNNKYNLQ